MYVYNIWYLFFLDDCLLFWMDPGNILRISSASNWVSFTRLYRDARPTEHKTSCCVAQITEQLLFTINTSNFLVLHYIILYNQLC